MSEKAGRDKLSQGALFFDAFSANVNFLRMFSTSTSRVTRTDVQCDIFCRMAG